MSSLFVDTVTAAPEQIGSDARRRFPEEIYGALRRSGPRKTLVLCPIGLGNFLMATPGLKKLSDAIGPENLHLLALKGAIKQLGEASGYFGQVHTWDPDKEKVGKGLALMAKLRRERFDYSVSLFPSGNWKFALFNAMIGAKTRIGFAYPNDRMPRLVQNMTAPLDMSLHDTDQNDDLIEALIGVDTSRFEPRRIVFPYTPEHKSAQALDDLAYFVCHPGSSAERGMKEKRLPPEAFAQVIEQIHRAFGLKCLLIGGPEEKTLRDAITGLAPDAVIACESRSFEELAALIEKAAFYLGNDSGLMHVSVALGKRCVVFFGPTDERRTGPYADSLRRGTTPHLIVRRDDLSCAPCWTIHTVGKNPPCVHGDTRCLRAMEVNAAWPRIEQYIRQLTAAA